MIELIRHIEILLLENDCVVVPGFGGFITHYMPASWSDEEKLFLPPMRTIGFNPQLKMNDGILVQSYMEVYNTDFSDATKILEQGVDKLVGLLHKEGKVDLFNIGELSLSIHGTYIFSPYDDKIITPLFYGLDSFEIKDIKTLQQSSDKKMVISQPKATITKKTYEIRINRALVRNAVAAVAAIFLFFYMSAPIENTYVEKENYAQLLPADLFGKIEQHSLLTSSVITTSAGTDVEIQPEVIIDNSFEIEAKVAEQEKISVPVAVKEVKVPKSKSKLHHIIIASLASENEAQTMVSNLKQEGYSSASVLTGEDKIRVSIASYNTREEANRQIVEIRKNNAYKSAWMLVR